MTEVKKCPSCGSPLLSIDKDYCGSCGVPFKDDSPLETEVETDEKH